MNAPVSKGQDLVIVKTLTPAIFGEPGGVQDMLSKIEAEVRAVKTDISTAAGRAAIASLAYKVARSKTALDEMGKEVVADWKKRAGLVDEERRKIRERLDALKDECRKPLTDWENAEKARVDGHEAALKRLFDAAVFVAGDPTVDEVDARLAQLAIDFDRAWEEFQKRAEEAKGLSARSLSTLRVKLVREAEEHAELDRLRKEDEARKQRERDEAIAREAAEKARRETEERARQEAEAAAAKAREEQDRVEREKRQAEEAARKAEADRVESERRRQEAEARAQKAEQDRIASEAKAKADAEAAAQRAADEKAAAERQAQVDRQVAAKRAEQEKQAAIEAERKRVADEQAKEAAEAVKREANKAHQKKINNEAKAALVAAGLSESAAVSAITAIAKGEVPHIRISY